VYGRVVDFDRLHGDDEAKPLRRKKNRKFDQAGEVMHEAFAVKDCALIAIATGEKAQDLRELRDRLTSTPSGCIYYHFWGGLLRPRFDDPEYQNDFAAWVRRGLHEPVLAERLAMVDPTDFKDIEDLRRELIDAVEERLYESELASWMRARDPFHFMKSQIVVFDTMVRVSHPDELAEIVPRLSLGSVFYHFIDARRRTETGRNDFSEWLYGFNSHFVELADRIANIDPYFTSLTDLRRELDAAFHNSGFFNGESL
jgi:hypothetical protein